MDGGQEPGLSSKMFNRLATYLSFVRFSHSVFALPFALTGALLASRSHRVAGTQILWIIVCMVTARSAAMGFNRLVDARFDAGNPRTTNRELPSGRMSTTEATLFIIVMSLAFVGAASQLNWLCFVLSPVALALIFWYSLAKRYTWGTQFFLGLAMAIAPVGGWLAAGGGRGWEPWLLGLAIALWVGGFDVLYACQDLDVDRRQRLKSIPVRFGVARSLWISRAMHAGTIACFWLLGLVAGLGTLYAIGVAAVAGLLVYEQSLVSADDLSQVKRAFDLNGYVGILYFVVTAISIYVGPESQIPNP
jgi:4-hydroxybenzoate polyprenyltransferase